MVVGGQRYSSVALPLGKRPDTHCVGGWMAPRPGLDRGENLAPARIRSPDHPGRRNLLYRLRYLGPQRSSPRSNELYNTPSERVVIDSLRNHKLKGGSRVEQHSTYSMKI
jgi:hypothetical protein